MSEGPLPEQEAANEQLTTQELIAKRNQEMAQLIRMLPRSTRRALERTKNKQFTKKLLKGVLTTLALFVTTACSVKHGVQETTKQTTYEILCYSGTAVVFYTKANKRPRTAYGHQYYIDNSDGSETVVNGDCVVTEVLP